MTRLTAALIALSVFSLVPAHASAKTLRAKSPKSKTTKRKPAQVSKTGVPRLPDGSPDYSKFPNPFVVKSWSFDAGASFGARAGVDYAEYGLGVNAYFYDWLAWRNVVYMRSSADASKNFGFDTSERFNYEIAKNSGISVFAAPGFRWGGSAGNGPFIEGGASVQIGPVVIGGGARKLFTSWTRTGAGNETQIFVNLFAGAWP